MPLTLLVDLDGTCYAKGVAIPGVADAIAELRRMACRLRFLTNTDSKSSDAVLGDLCRMGLPVEREEVFGAVDSCLHYLAGRGTPSVLALVPERVQSLFARFRCPADSADCVVLGDPRDTCSYPLLNRALRCLMAGAELVAMQKGRFFLSADGPQLDTGGFVALLEYAASTQATLVGKPSRHFFAAAVGRELASDDRVIVIGDDARTDIAGAAEMGWPSVLVHTGKYELQAHEPPPAMPTWQIDSIADLPGLVARSLL